MKFKFILLILCLAFIICHYSKNTPKNKSKKNVKPLNQRLNKNSSNDKEKKSTNKIVKKSEPKNSKADKKSADDKEKKPESNKEKKPESSKEKNSSDVENIKQKDPFEDISKYQQLEAYISKYATQIEVVKEKPKLAQKVHTLFKVFNLQEGSTPNPDDKFKKQAGYYAQWLDKPFRECIYPVSEVNSMTYCENTIGKFGDERVVLCKKFQCINCCNNFKEVVDSLRLQGEAILALNITPDNIVEYTSESQLALCRSECEAEYSANGRHASSDQNPNESQENKDNEDKDDKNENNGEDNNKGENENQDNNDEDNQNEDNEGNEPNEEVNEEDLNKPEPEEPAQIPQFPEDCEQE